MIITKIGLLESAQTNNKDPTLTVAASGAKASLVDVKTEVASGPVRRSLFDTLSDQFGEECNVLIHQIEQFQSFVYDYENFGNF